MKIKFLLFLFLVFLITVKPLFAQVAVKRDGSFGDLTVSGFFWTSTENSTKSWYRLLGYAHADLYRDDFDKNRGYSVRCVHD